MTDGHTSANYHYVSRKRRPKEDGRFITGRGRFVADIELPGAKHVALVPSPHPRANIVSIDASAALALDGVHYVLTGDELAANTRSLFHGLDLPHVKWFPLAVGMTRYAGEWVAAVVADSRYIAEDAAELVEVAYESLPAAIDSEQVIEPDAPLVHPDHGSNLLFRKTFTWGPVAEDFGKAEHTISYRARWGRSSTVPKSQNSTPLTMSSAVKGKRYSMLPRNRNSPPTWTPPFTGEAPRKSKPRMVEKPPAK